MGDDVDGPGVAEAIESLRHELTAALQAGDVRRDRMRFRLEEPVVLELQAVVTKVGEGKLGWKIIEVGGSYTAANTHKLTLRLTPEWWDGGQYTTDFRISASLPASDSAGRDGGAAARPRIDDGIEDD
jgi:hypothetical protein